MHDEALLIPVIMSGDAMLFSSQWVEAKSLELKPNQSVVPRYKIPAFTGKRPALKSLIVI